jgi:hypothetical protein
MSASTPPIQQSVNGQGNIFSGSGPVTVNINNPAPLAPTDAETRRNIRILLLKVKTFWIEDVLEKSVHNAAMLDLGKELRTEAVDHPWGTIGIAQCGKPTTAARSKNRSAV